MGETSRARGTGRFALGSHLGGQWWLEMSPDRIWERSALEAALERELRGAGPCGGYLRVAGWCEEDESFLIGCAPPGVEPPDSGPLGRVPLRWLVRENWEAVARTIRACCDACPFDERFCEGCCAVI